LPDAKTADGEYQWDGENNYDEPLPQYDWIIERMDQPLARDASRDIPLSDLDEPQSIRIATDFAKTVAPSVEGEGGDNHLIDVVFQTRDFGVSEGTCYEILSEHFNPRCIPPWEEEELLKKVANGYLYAKKPAGNRAPSVIAEKFEDIPEDEIPKDAPADSPVSIYSFQGEPPEREWVIDEWLPKGEVSSLYGDGGIGKTLLAEQLGFCVAYGLSFLGLKTTQMQVFAAFAEDDLHEAQRRVNKFSRFYFFEPPDKGAEFQVYAYPSNDYTMTHFKGDGKPTPGKFYPRLRSFLSAMSSDPKLVILDTLADVFDGNENIRNQANYFIKNVLRKLCVDFNATVLLLAHPSRAGLSSADILSGSTAWNNSVRNRLALTKHDTIPDARVLTRVKSNYAKSGEQILLTWRGGVFAKGDREDLVNNLVDKYAEHVLRLIGEAAAAGAPLGDTRNHGNYIFTQLERFSNGAEVVSQKAMKEIIANLISQGRVERVKGEDRGNGLYPKG
jgi:hypothetical protein